MFENTVLALKQIQDRLSEVSSKEELIEDASSQHEARAIKEFFSMIQDMAETCQELDFE